MMALREFPQGAVGRQERSHWIIDPARTHVEFAATLLGLVTITGRFDTLGGTLMIDDDWPVRSQAALTVDAASVATHNARRDAHLRSADYFDVARFPTIAFASTSIAPLEARAYRVTGYLTIRGITRPLVLDVTWEDSFGQPRPGRAGFTAEARIKRTAFRLGRPSATNLFVAAIGDDVTVRVRAKQRANGSSAGRRGSQTNPSGARCSDLSGGDRPDRPHPAGPHSAAHRQMSSRMTYMRKGIEEKAS
jgi:polyisoprenoid-binding protein YceI